MEEEKQPTPPLDDTIVKSIIEQFQERSRVGKHKYGVTLDRTDLTTLDWIEHAKQEAMDFILYLERLKRDVVAIQHKDSPPLMVTTDDGNDGR